MKRRERSRSSSSQTRAPLADRVPRPMKRTAGRTNAPQIPANIRADRVTLDDDDRVYIRRRLGEMLGKYAASIERVTVRLRDINGPRGGVDLLCRIKVVLSDLPSVVVEEQAASFGPAFTTALSGIERTVQRRVQRRRTRPIRPRR
jgi:ribosome-associated translation inhibitor RaiA